MPGLMAGGGGVAVRIARRGRCVSRGGMALGGGRVRLRRIVYVF